jgi:DNA-binding GntR family transcriptional regulator
MSKERLYADLRQRIMTLELEPGASLDETAPGAEYEISCTPLRDVLRQLAGES